MTDELDDLPTLREFRRQLEAIGSVPARRRPRRGLALVAAALVVAGTAAAAVVRSGPAEPSKPLHGRLAPARGTASIDAYRVSVWPYLSAGDPGWCVSAGFSGHRRAVAAATGCGPAMAAGTALLTGVSTVGPRSEFVAVMVGPNVATVKLGTRRFTPRSDPRLPRSWRAVIAQVRTPRVRSPHGTTPSAIPQIVRVISPIALDSAGRVIEQRVPRTSPLRTPAHNVSPSRLPTSGCGLTGRLKPTASKVAAERTTTPVPTVGPALRACFVAQYNIGGHYLQAALLLDATNPTLRAPGLPGSIRLAGGITQAPGAILARRSGRAWIVVRAGPASARRALLASLTARY